MYSSTTVDATDPDLFVNSGRPIAIEYTVTARGPFQARSTFFNLEHIYAQRSHERLARFKRVQTLRGGVLFLTEPGPSMFVNGAEIGIDQMAVVDAGETYTSRLSGATQWGAMTLAKEDMDALCTPGADLCKNRLRGAVVFTPPPAAFARLRSLHGYMGRLREITPEVLTDTELAHYLEQSLVEAMQATLSTYAGDSRLGSTARSHHQLVAKRFRALVQAQADGQLHMPEISRKIGVSDRTLRLACQQQLGVSPGEYVMLRRMQTVRRALQKADPDLARVTTIATDHGFWELGRFSVKYRQIFGESPSVTLRRGA
jgi:AraC-like DNA-binding protein